MREGSISGDYIREKLTLARGDLFVAASLLGCTAQELDRYIRASEELQAFAAAIVQIKRDRNYDAMSAQQFEAELEQRLRAYRVDALETLHQLATAEEKTAAGRRVKYFAAKYLYGGTSGPVGPTEHAETLEELNELYRQNAPRISEIRHTVIKLRAPRSVEQLPEPPELA